MSSSKHYIMGIDGGGTKTEAWLAIIEQDCGPQEIREVSQFRIVGRGIAGPSNQRAVGTDVAVQNLKRAIDGAFADYGIERKSIDAICFALAGADRESDRTVIENYARADSLARSISVVNDAVPLLHCGPELMTNDAGGIALICGTGSMAWGSNSENQTARSGGWGYLFSDEGSSFAIGRDALQAVSKMLDGRGTPTQLLDRISKTLSLEQPTDLVNRIYGAQFPKDVIASLSETVFLAADDNDSVASEILTKAARDLASLVSSVAHRLRLEAFARLALAGAVLIRQPRFCELVLKEIEDQGVRIRQHWLVDHPVLGALRLAANQLSVVGQ